jgi:thioesterase domain-containing protein/acyl carrier protein
MFASLRCLLFGGEAVDPACVAEVLAARPPERFTHVYGPTETTTFATWHLIRKLTTDSGPVPIGRAIQNTQLYVLNEQMEPVPVGVIGELYIGGDGLARGYWRRPELTAEKFVPDRFSQSPGARLYRSGDRVRWLAEGELEFIGRADHQVKIRGHRIELGEVEALLRAHAGVDEAVLLVREDVTGDKRLVAYLTGKSGEREGLPQELKNYLRDKLPEYMVPSALVLLDKLPLTPNGKVDRASLPKPEHKDYVSAKAQVAPRNVFELQVLEVWRQVLGTDELGVADHFFEVGGHSLAAVRLMAGIQRRFGIKLPIATLFNGKTDTIEAMGRLLKDKTFPAITPLVSLTAENGKQPLFCIHPGNGEVTWFLNLARHLGEAHPVYALQDPAVFQQGDFRSSIEEMAAAYIAEIRQVRQHGPYHLAGYSFGGLVAFEMVQQLMHSGDEVGTLILLDAASPRFMRDLHQDENENDLEEITRREMALLTGPESPNNIQDDGQGKEGCKSFEQAQLVRNVQIFRARLHAGMRYSSSRYPGKIILFRSSEIDPHMREDLRTKMRNLQEIDPTMGWETLSLHPVETHIVPGNHVTMGWEPQVRYLAKGIIHALEGSAMDVLEEANLAIIA